MNWKMRSWSSGGGDTPLTWLRYYEYAFDQSFWARLKRRRHVVELPFEFGIEPNIKKHDNKAHADMMVNKPFLVKNRFVFEWFNDFPPVGSVVLLFQVDSSMEQIILNKRPRCMLQARFQDPGQAMLFKLAFGGQ